MRQILVLLLLAGSLWANDPTANKTRPCKCHANADLLYQPVVRAMWAKDEGDYSSARGFIRVAVHPRWSEEFFYNVRLNAEGHPAIITSYHLPKGTETITKLIEAALKRDPCTKPESIAAQLPVNKESVNADAELQNIIERFFALRLSPRPIPSSVRLDATEYEVEFRGDDTFVYDTDDYETPIAQWVRSLMDGVASANTRAGRTNSVDNKR